MIRLNSLDTDELDETSGKNSFLNLGKPTIRKQWPKDIVIPIINRTWQEILEKLYLDDPVLDSPQFERLEQTWMEKANDQSDGKKKPQAITRVTFSKEKESSTSYFSPYSLPNHRNPAMDAFLNDNCDTSRQGNDLKYRDLHPLREKPPLIRFPSIQRERKISTGVRIMTESPKTENKPKSGKCWKMAKTESGKNRQKLVVEGFGKIQHSLPPIHHHEYLQSSGLAPSLFTEFGEDVNDSDTDSNTSARSRNNSASSSASRIKGKYRSRNANKSVRVRVGVYPTRNDKMTQVEKDNMYKLYIMGDMRSASTDNMDSQYYKEIFSKYGRFGPVRSSQSL